MDASKVLDFLYVVDVAKYIGLFSSTSNVKSIEIKSVRTNNKFIENKVYTITTKDQRSLNIYIDTKTKMVKDKKVALIKLTDEFRDYYRSYDAFQNAIEWTFGYYLDEEDNLITGNTYTIKNLKLLTMLMWNYQPIFGKTKPTFENVIGYTTKVETTGYGVKIENSPEIIVSIEEYNTYQKEVSERMALEDTYLMDDIIKELE